MSDNELAFTTCWTSGITDTTTTNDARMDPDHTVGATYRRTWTRPFEPGATDTLTAYVSVMTHGAYRFGYVIRWDFVRHGRGGELLLNTSTGVMHRGHQNYPYSVLDASRIVAALDADDIEHAMNAMH